MSDQGPYAEFDGPLIGAPKRNGHSSFSDKMDTRIALVWSRASIFIICFLITVVILPGGIWWANHITNQQEEQAERQRRTDLKMVELNVQMLNILSDQLKGSKNIMDTMEARDRTTNDRINAVSEWARNISTDLKTLSQFVYQNVRQITPAR